MSVLNVLPTLNCVYIGRSDRPLNAPDHAPFSVRSYVAQVAELTEPEQIRWCDGSGPATGPALLEAVAPPTVLTCTDIPGDAAAADHWTDPTPMRQQLRTAFDAVMRGRTLWVLPFASAGRLGVLLTDTPAVVNAVAAVADTGDEPLGRIENGAYWTTVVHSRGTTPGTDGYLVRFPASSETWALGLAHRGSSLLGTDEPAAPSVR